MNKFDAALHGYIDYGVNQLDGYEHYELGGLGKKLKKKFKKVSKAVKKVGKVVKKITKPVIDIHKKVARPFIKAHEKVFKTAGRKLLPDKVEHAVEKVVKSPITKALALGAVAFLAGPAVLAALSSVSPAAGAALASSGLVGQGGSFTTYMSKQLAQELLKKGVDNVVKARLKDKANKIHAAVTAEQQAQVNAEIDAELSEIIDDPAFVITAREMLKQGKSIEEIIQVWINSQSYQEAATVAATNAVYPAAYNEIMATGQATPQMAHDLATAAGAQVAEEAIDEVKSNGGDFGKIALIALPVIMAMVGG